MKKIAALGIFFLWSAVVPAAESKAFKVYLSVDMEGIWGVVHSDQTNPELREYGDARKWMADDTNAVIAGLLEAGAGEIVVNDSHGSMRNIAASDLDPRAILISGSPKPLSMMEGIDATFDACIFVGYHARSGTADAVLDHTISSGSISSIRVNGKEMPELGLNAAIAGYFNVPVVMVTGDAAACRQAKDLLGQKVVTVAVKEGIGRQAARMLSQAESRKILQQGARNALLNLPSCQPLLWKQPFHFELVFHQSSQAQWGELLPMVKRPEARTLTFSTSDYLEGFKLLRALIALASIK